MVTKLIEVLEENINHNGQLRDRVRVTITDTSGERRYISEKERPKVNGNHEKYAESLKNAMIRNKDFE